MLVQFKVESLRSSMLDLAQKLRSDLTQHAGFGSKAKVRHARRASPYLKKTPLRKGLQETPLKKHVRGFLVSPLKRRARLPRAGRELRSDLTQHAGRTPPG